MEWIGQHIYDQISRFRNHAYFEDSVTLSTGKSITMDEYTSGTISITKIQDSGTTFNDNDTSLMTAAAIADKIEAYGYSTASGDITGITITADDAGTATDTSGDLAITVSGGEGIDTSATGSTLTIAGEDASDTNKGVVELATTDETTTGTDAGRAVTPDGLKDGYQGSTNVTTLGTLSSLAVTSASDLGSNAVTITNQDIDKLALNVIGSNTTANIMGVSSESLTTGDGVAIALEALTTGAGISLDINDALTASAEKALVKIDYDKAGSTTSSQTSTTTGLDIDMADAATNHASGAVNMTGIAVNIDSANAQGSIAQKGLVLNIAGDGVGDGVGTAGISMEVMDGGTDIKMMSHADTADYCAVATTTNGATSITTVDGGSDNAHLSLVVDGDFSIASTGIDIAANGTITNASWSGTAVATDRQKHLANFEFEGFSTGDGTNYMIPELNSDTKAPFEHQTSTGSDGLTATAVIILLRTASHVMPYAGTLKLWKGWATSSGTSQTVDIGLYKVTLVNNDDADVSPVALKNTSFTSVGNSKALTFAETSFSVAFAAGDILISAIRNGTNAKRCDFASTLVVEWD